MLKLFGHYYIEKMVLYMKKQSTMGGFAILSAATLIVKILSVLYLPFLLAILGDEGYGYYQAAYTIFVFVYAITNTGLPQAISKLVSELTAVGNYKDAVKAFKMARFILLTVGFLMSLILFFSAGFLSRILNFPKSYLAVLFLVPTVFLSTVTSSYRGYFQGRQNMIPTAVSQVLEQIINLFFTLLLSYILIKHNLERAVAGGTFATSIAALFAGIFLVFMYKKNKESRIIRLHNPSIERLTNKEIFKKIVNYSLPLIAYQVLFYAGNLVDLGNIKSRLLHSGILEAQATTLYGNLTRSNQLINVPNAIIASLSVALLPAIATAVARSDTKNLREKINSSFKICFMISIPSAFVLSVLSYPIFEFMHFHGGAKIMMFGSYVLIIMSCVQIFSSILQGMGKLYIVTFFLIFGVIGKIIMNYIFVGIPSINILGAILGNVVYYTVPLILDNIILVKILKIKINIFKYAIKPVIASLVMSLVLYFSYNGLHYLISKILSLAFNLKTILLISNGISVIIALMLGAYSYFYIMALIRGITANDMKILPSKINRIIPKSIHKIIKEK
jgi:stage V sporulation protein B